MEIVDTPDTIHSERSAEPGQRCTCGCQAGVVYLGGRHGEVGYCGLPDGACTVSYPLRGSVELQMNSYGDLGRCPKYQMYPAVIR